MLPRLVASRTMSPSPSLARHPPPPKKKTTTKKSGERKKKGEGKRERERARSETMNDHTRRPLKFLRSNQARGFTRLKGVATYCKHVQQKPATFPNSTFAA